MTLILPTQWENSGCLADVLHSVLRSVMGENNTFSLPRARSSIVLVIDGLGSINLQEYRGHARKLFKDFSTSGETIYTVFPSTTVSALSSLTTGVLPGTHGMVGYQVRDPVSGNKFNQLSGWEEKGQPITPESWQQLPTLFESASVSTYVLADPRHHNSGLTRAILRGAEYVSEKGLEKRVKRAAHIARTETALIYLYIPNIDIAGHAHGVGSDKWVRELENLDSLYTELLQELNADIGVIVTADHGMVNVPPEHQIIFSREQFAEFSVIAGEPRCVQLYFSDQENLDEAKMVSSIDIVKQQVKDVAVVYSKEELLDSKIFGETVTDTSVLRMGDVFIVPRDTYAIYFDDDLSGTAMVGQHGGLSEKETSVPFIRSGAYRKLA